MPQETVPEYTVPDPRPPALQNFEIRGWVIPYLGGEPGVLCGQYGDEEEYEISVALDLNWEADRSENTTPLNSLDVLMREVPGINVMAFATDRCMIVSSDLSFCGGMAAAAIHVEVDAWGPARGGMQRGLGPDFYQRRAPFPGWNECGTERVGDRTYPTYFHRDILPEPGGLQGHGALRLGDYVSVVGTLWRDGDHHGNPNDRERLQNARSCWRSTSGQYYWTEMHAPDKVRKLPQKPLELSNSLLGYMACNRTSHDYTLMDEVTLPRPPGWQNASITGVDSSVFTGFGSSMEAPTIDRVNNRVSVRGTVGTWGSCVQAFYKVNWTCGAGWAHCDGNPAHNCETNINTDRLHCGNCATICSGNQQCINGTCQSPPPTCNPTTCPASDSLRHVAAQHCTGDYGTCVIDTCEARWANCTGDSSTGCQTQLGTSSNCLSCNNICGSGQSCHLPEGCRAPTCQEMGQCGTQPYCGPCCGDELCLGICCAGQCQHGPDCN